MSCRLRTSCVLRWGRARTTVSSCWLKRKDEIMHTYRLPRQARHSQESETTECMLLNARWSPGGDARLRRRWLPERLVADLFSAPVPPLWSRLLNNCSGGEVCDARVSGLPTHPPCKLRNHSRASSPCRRFSVRWTLNLEYDCTAVSDAYHQGAAACKCRTTFSSGWSRLGSRTTGRSGHRTPC